MDFDLNDDQATVLNAIAPLLNRHRRLPDPAPAVSYFYGNALEADLTEGGWFAADSDALGLFEAGLLVEEIARLPCALEAMVSLIIAPRIGLPPERRPYALMRKDRPGIPSRYLPMARTVIIDAGSHVEVLDLDGLDVPALDGFLAAPYGRLPEGAMDGAEPLGGIPAGRLRHLWRLGLAAEISGGGPGRS